MSITEIKLLKEQIFQLKREKAMLLSLLEEATLSEMGGIPDLFYPERGWDEWDARVEKAIKDMQPERVKG